MITGKQVLERLERAGTGSSPTPGLHARLAAVAERGGLLDVSYRTVDSPLGPLLLAATENGLVRVAFGKEDHDSVLSRLAAAISPRILRAPRRLDEPARQLDQYFARKRRAFTVPVDLQLAHGFRRSVLLHLRDIPYGRTRSYAAIAKAAGNPRAVRAAASACSHNPLPLVIPCHRVVRTDGGLGEYLGGPGAKRALLSMEAAG
jgi:methylated-DNA-[protein]-cysteine S-methyltransferase